MLFAKSNASASLSGASIQRLRRGRAKFPNLSVASHMDAWGCHAITEKESAVRELENATSIVEFVSSMSPHWNGSPKTSSSSPFNFSTGADTYASSPFDMSSNDTSGIIFESFLKSLDAQKRASSRFPFASSDNALSSAWASAHKT